MLWIVSIIIFFSFLTLSGGVSFRHSSTYFRNPACGDAVWLTQNVRIKSSISPFVGGAWRLGRLRLNTLLSVWEEDVEGHGEEQGEECWESGGVGEGGALWLCAVVFTLVAAGLVVKHCTGEGLSRWRRTDSCGSLKWRSSSQDSQRNISSR